MSERNAPKALPPLDLLRGFEAAARHLSFTKAAAELFVTQSAISRQIRSLEEHLGIALFRRDHRALTLTEKGQLLYRAVSDALRRLRDVTQKLQARGTSVISITTSVSFTSLWLIPRLAKFRAQHPGLDVHISASNEIVDLEREQLDLAIRYYHPEQAPPAAIKLFADEVFPVCSPALAGDAANPLDEPADLARHVLLELNDEKNRAWFVWSAWLDAMNLPELTPAGLLRFNQYDHVIHAALNGQGIALGRYPLLERYLADGSLVAPFQGRSKTSRAYFVISRKAASAESRLFTDWLLREAQG